MRKFKVVLSKFARVEVSAKDWQEAKKKIEQKIRNPDKMDEKTEQEIDNNSTRWFLDYVEEIGD